jgi:hypothetical protein
MNRIAILMHGDTSAKRAVGYLRAGQPGAWAGGWAFILPNFVIVAALLDEQGRVLVVFRLPARLAVFQPQDGQLINAVATCGDSDDVFADHKRHRVYVSCGEGFVDVFAVQSNSYARISHIATVSGARTALFVPEIDRLFLAVRASGGAPASIWVFRPAE